MLQAILDSHHQYAKHAIKATNSLVVRAQYVPIRHMAMMESHVLQLPTARKVLKGQQRQTAQNVMRAISHQAQAVRNAGVAIMVKLARHVNKFRIALQAILDSHHRIAQHAT